MFSGAEDLVPYLIENTPGIWSAVEDTVGGYTVKDHRSGGLR